MRKFVTILVIYLKAILTVLKSGKIFTLRRANSSSKNLPALTAKDLVAIEVHKSMRKIELASKEAKLSAEIASTPMSFTDRHDWDRRIASAKQDPTQKHDLVVLDYAEKWARLMELRMQQGQRLPKVATDTAMEAYTNDEMSMADFSSARRILFCCWKYGRELSLCYYS